MIRRRVLLLFGLALVACLGALSLTPAPPLAAADLPARIADRAFWRMISDFSEPNGYFHSDNFMSNEKAFQLVIPELTKTLAPEGVYIGVGPEQNFTYLVALRPKIAFIIDIRRQNMLEQLLYKALIELSADRAEFLSRLYSRPRPAGLGADSTVDTLFEEYERATPQSGLFDQNLLAAKHQLVVHHGFALTEDDLKGIEHVFSVFYAGGPNLNYSFSPGGGGAFGWFPTYKDLMTETDGAGEHRGYLATEDGFRILSRLENNNLIIPVVGDFAGPKAIRSVGRYLKEHGATVTAFYTSNVEQYLFQQDDDWRKFFANVATLPTAPSSTFIRSVTNRGFQYQAFNAGRRSMPRLCSIEDLLKAFDERRIASYSDVIRMSK